MCLHQQSKIPVTVKHSPTTYYMGLIYWILENTCWPRMDVCSMDIFAVVFPSQVPVDSVKQLHPLPNPYWLSYHFTPPPSPSQTQVDCATPVHPQPSPSWLCHTSPFPARSKLTVPHQSIPSQVQVDCATPVHQGITNAATMCLLIAPWWPTQISKSVK